MSDTTTTTPVPAPSPAPQPPTAKRSLQDKIIEAYISDADTLLETASTDPDIAPILLKHGYDEVEFQIGRDLISAAQGAYEGRTGGIGKQLKSTETLQQEIKAARNDYAAFREIARGAFPSQSDRVALSLTGDVPDDFQRFLTLAHASYAAAGKDPCKTKMTKRGYGDVRLAELNQALDGLTGTDADQNEAEGNAIGDTTARDQAYAALKEYIKELKATCRGAFRGKDALLAKLKL